MYYLGFLKQNTKDVVIFKSLKAPKKGDFSYFVRVMGPYSTEDKARTGLSQLKEAYGEYGYRENPSPASRKRFLKKGIVCGKDHAHSGRCAKYGNPLKNSISDKQALALTKKIVAYGKKLFKHEQSELRRGNPVNEHFDKFIRGMKTLEKYAVGSKPYIDALAKTYADLQVAKAKMGK